MSELALLGLIAALHLVALAGGAVLVIAMVRSDGDGPSGAAPDGGGGRDDAGPRPPQPVGPPLPDASQARVRLREPGRLADRLPDRHHRPAPAQPARQGTRGAPKTRQPS